MAEVRQCFLRVKHVYGNYLCQQSVLWSHSGHGKCLFRSSHVAAIFVLTGSSNGGKRPTSVAASQDGYTSSRKTDQDDTTNSIKVCFNPPYNHTHEQDLIQTMTKHQVKVWRTLFCGNVCVQHFNWSQSRSYSGNGGRSEPLYKSKSGYYEVLEVLPTATQAQIKTAYYKQSFTFHPDRNPGSETSTTTRFSEISEAYMVLGNKGLRKKYDRGLLSLSDLTASPSTPSSSKDPSGGSTKQHRSQTVVGHARGGVFDFDAFYKSHYGGQLQKQRDIKARKEEMERKKEEEQQEKKIGKLMDVGVGLLMVVAFSLMFTLK